MKLKDFLDILKQTYVQLCTIFALIALGSTIFKYYLPQFALIGYALIPLAILAIYGARYREIEMEIKTWKYLLLLIFAIALLLRFLPYLFSKIPLGYDPGFYKYTMDVYISALPEIPEEALPLWLRSMQEQALFILTDITYLFGIEPEHWLLVIFPFIAALISLPIFILVRKIYSNGAALIATSFYAFSYTQFAAFEHSYIKNIIGLFLLCLALYALSEKRYALLSLLYAGIGIYHRPTFLLLTLALLFYFVLKRDRKLLGAGIMAAILILPFWLPRLDIYYPMVLGLSSVGEVEAGGQFFDYKIYEEVALAYFPFAFIGMAWLITKKHFYSLAIYFSIALAIVVLQLFFFRRYIIMLDFGAIILAGIGIWQNLENKIFPRYLAIAIALILIFASAYLAINEARESKPLVSKTQFEAINWIKDNTEVDSYILASNLDAPWLLGWSQRKIIAPGLFHWDNHSKSEWEEFFKAKEYQEIKGFLKEPLYLYSAIGGLGNMEKIENEHFKKVYVDQDVVIYRYLGER